MCSSSDGQLGLGTTVEVQNPATGPYVPVDCDVAQVSAADDHTCILCTNGSAVCFGRYVQCIVKGLHEYCVCMMSLQWSQRALGDQQYAAGMDAWSFFEHGRNGGGAACDGARAHLRALCQREHQVLGKVRDIVAYSWRNTTL